MTVLQENPMQTMQAPAPDHPLAKFGHHRLPFRLWRLSPRLHGFIGALRDMWLIATGRITLHIAWQEGYHNGTQSEYRRIMINGGELVPYVTALRAARGALWEMGVFSSREQFQKDPAVVAI